MRPLRARRKGLVNVGNRRHEEQPLLRTRRLYPSLTSNPHHPVALDESLTLWVSVFLCVQEEIRLHAGPLGLFSQTGFGPNTPSARPTPASLDLVFIAMTSVSPILLKLVLWPM